MTTIPFRCLVLEERNSLGCAEGPHRYRCHVEFWMQMCMMFRSQLGRHLSETVTAGQAKAVADIIEETGNERWWGIHLAAWGDSRRRAVGALVKFLRAGGFVVVRPGCSGRITKHFS